MIYRSGIRQNSLQRDDSWRNPRQRGTMDLTIAEEDLKWTLRASGSRSSNTFTEYLYAGTGRIASVFGGIDHGDGNYTSVSGTPPTSDTTFSATKTIQYDSEGVKSVTASASVYYYDNLRFETYRQYGTWNSLSLRFDYGSPVLHASGNNGNYVYSSSTLYSSDVPSESVTVSNAVAVPEPSSLLLTLSAAWLIGRRHRRKRSQR